MVYIVHRNRIGVLQLQLPISNGSQTHHLSLSLEMLLNLVGTLQDLLQKFQFALFQVALLPYFVVFATCKPRLFTRPETANSRE
jgi:hypothetical protein